MVEDEVVRRRGWLAPARFLELLAISNLLPGPNSTELVLHVGRERAGLRGMLVAGIAFILPAALIVGALAGLYVATQALPAAQHLLAGVLPVVLAIVILALFRLARTALRAPLELATGLLVLGFAFLPRVNELALLVAAGAFVAAQVASHDRRRFGDAGVALLAGVAALFFALAPAFTPAPPVASAAGAVAAATTAATPGGLFLAFLKIGSVLYGSGYVLIAWLEAEFVTTRGWLDARTLLDAVAVGQVTPGPLFTTATFVGGITAGAWGAVAATIGIFLPAFVFVAVSGTIERFVHARPSTRAFLGGVAVASLALMAKAAVTLGAGALPTPWAVGIAALALLLLARTRIPSTALIVAGGIIGLVAGRFLESGAPGLW
jgi:chromate transporter